MTETRIQIGMPHRVNAYAEPFEGGVRIDTEQMIVDLVMVCKVAEVTKSQFLDKMAEMWDSVEVVVFPPEPNQ